MRIFLIIAVLFLLLGSVELFAQYQYDFEFDVICSGSWRISIRLRSEGESEFGPEVYPSGRYRGSQLLTLVEPMEPLLTGIRVKAWSDFAVFEEIRNPSLHGVNYFYIDLTGEPEPPGPPVPQGGDE